MCFHRVQAEVQVRLLQRQLSQELERSEKLRRQLEASSLPNKVFTVHSLPARLIIVRIWLRRVFLLTQDFTVQALGSAPVPWQRTYCLYPTSPAPL